MMNQSKAHRPKCKLLIIGHTCQIAYLFVVISGNHFLLHISILGEHPNEAFLVLVAVPGTHVDRTKEHFEMINVDTS